MKLRRFRENPQLARSVRVAAVAALLIGVLYVSLVVVFDFVDANHLVAQVDQHLSERLSDVTHSGDVSLPPGEADDDHDLKAAPVVLWRVDANGHTVALSDGAPALPAGTWSENGVPTTSDIGKSAFRLLAVRADGSWLVAGQSLSDTEHVEGVLVAAEIIAGPVLIVAMFLGALVIGLKASGPVEQARRRQLEFTADASHELRTPLSVIEAEIDLALGGAEGADNGSRAGAEDASRYKETLKRLGREGERLRRIVEDLLWLARFDSEPPAPRDEPVDLATIAEGCSDRFSGVARSRGIGLSVRADEADHAWVNAPPDWIDRLTAVLVDNACRYAGPGGTVHIDVSSSGHRVVLAVEDSGPGIPVAERERLFDRFHRATDEGGGAGLGLAIADAVVRSTGGRWRVADSSLGGAHMEVSWHRAQSREPDRPAPGGHRAPRRGAEPQGRRATRTASAREDRPAPIG